MTREEYAGLGLLVLGELRSSAALTTVPSFAWEKLEPTIRAIPPQFYRLGADQPLGNWLNVAAAIEAQGLHDIAFDLLAEIRRLFVRDAELVEQRVADAFIWLRRGRIARTSGRLDDAELCYSEALLLVPRPFPSDDGLWWSDILPHVWLGFGILAIGRGNYPVAERETSRVLDARVPGIWHITGHLQMSIVLRKRARPDEALSHVWAALDLMNVDDGRRAEALVFLGEVLMGLQEDVFAAQAHLGALATAPVLRVQAAALCGILTLLARANEENATALEAVLEGSAWARRHLTSREEVGGVNRLIGFMAHRLRGVPASLDTSDPSAAGVVEGLTRHDQSILGRSLAELLESRGKREEALAWLTVVERIAERHDFHERKFEVDTLRRRWTTAVANDTEMTVPRNLPGRKNADPVWTRMADLEALSTVDMVKGR